MSRTDGTWRADWKQAWQQVFDGRLASWYRPWVLLSRRGDFHGAYLVWWHWRLWLEHYGPNRQLWLGPVVVTWRAR